MAAIGTLMKNCRLFYQILYDLQRLNLQNADEISDKTKFVIYIRITFFSKLCKFITEMISIENINKRTMMVLYRSPENQVVKVYKGYKYQMSQFKAK